MKIAITRIADRAIVDIAFEHVGRRWQESAARAHEFVAAFYRAGAQEPKFAGVGVPEVSERGNCHVVRIESDDDEDFANAVALVNRLAKEMR